MQFQRDAEHDSAALNTTVLLRLFGACEPAEFAGIYSLRAAQSKVVSRGTFRLTRKAPDQAKGDGTRSTTASTKSIAACTSANTRCLATCPRGDSDVEFLCANRCRTRLQTCKGQVGKGPAGIE